MEPLRRSGSLGDSGRPGLGLVTSVASGASDRRAPGEGAPESESGPGLAPAAVPPSRSSPAWAVTLLAGAAGSLVFLFVVDPATAGFLPPCPLRALTGWLCPGCGSTRAVHQLLHGRVVAALALNPLLPLALGALGWVFLSELLSALGRPPFPVPRLGRAWLWGVGGLVVLFWIARNLPGSPLGAAAAG